MEGCDGLIYFSVWNSKDSNGFRTRRMRDPWPTIHPTLIRAPRWRDNVVPLRERTRSALAHSLALVYLWKDPAVNVCEKLVRLVASHANPRLADSKEAMDLHTASSRMTGQGGAG